MNFQNNKYNTLYKDITQIEAIGVIQSDKQEKEYYNIYKLKIENLNKSNKYKNTCIYIKIKKDININLQYGDKVKIKGEFLTPNVQRNFGSFNYMEYLKTLKIYGNVNINNIEIIDKKQGNTMLYLSNQISSNIREKIDSLLKNPEASILKGLLLGYTSDIEEDIKEDFRIANISHILAVSGMHVAYLIIGIEIFLRNGIGKKKTRIVIIIILIIYMFITGFSSSVVRASIMGILVTFSGIIYRKNDIYTSISLSLLIILINNPFKITSVGLQFSYLGTLGIIILNKNIFRILRNIKFENGKKYKINRKIIIFIGKIKEVLAVTLSAQLAILPVMIYHFNMLGVYFLITNILVSFIIGFIIIIGFSTVFISFIYLPIGKIITQVLVISINILFLISKMSELPFSKIYIPTPNIFIIVIYYILIFIFNYIYHIYNSKNPTNTNIRIKNLIELFKYKFNIKKKRNTYNIILLIFIIVLVYCIPKNLKVNFIDVGQGDSTFITTPTKKTILIDGGGSAIQSFDVGKNTLIPYILDRGYTKIDYLLISHFDSDHVGGILTLMKEIKVKNVIIGKQFENSENYQEFLEIVKANKIKIHVVEAGQRVNIERDLYFDILWPDSKNIINENSINNNSLVCKMVYKNFSILFTGDIEGIAEDSILLKYNNTNKLQSTILKVAHHGSKTSSTQNFIYEVKPKISIIQVGENNTFGHPNNEVLERLQRI